jgi:hypothetical protein
MATKKDVLDVVDTLVSRFVYDDRKGSDQLPLEELNRLIKTGEVTVDEIVSTFRQGLVDTFG